MVYRFIYIYFRMFNFLKEREKQQQQPAHFRDDFRYDRGRLDRKIIVSHLAAKSRHPWYELRNVYLIKPLISGGIYLVCIKMKPSSGKINPDLARERGKASFDTRELTYLLYGGRERTERKKFLGENID